MTVGKLEPEQSCSHEAQPAQSGHERKGLPRLLAVFWRRKLLMLASLLICLGLGGAYLAVTPPRYLASATLHISPQLGTADLASRNTPRAGSADTAGIEDHIQRLTSRTVLAEVAKQVGLADDPEFNGSRRILLERWRDLGAPLDPGAPLDQGVDLGSLKNAITIRHPVSCDIVTVDALARDPKKAAEIANALAQAYVGPAHVGPAQVGLAQVADAKPARGTGTGDDMRFVGQALDTLSSQIRALDKRVEEKAETKPVQTSHLRTQAQERANLIRALTGARTREADAQARLSEIDRMAAQGHLDATSGAIHSQVIEELLQRQTAVDQEVSRLSEVLGSRHPTMIDALERRQRLRTLITAELRRLEPGLKQDGQSAHAEVARITAELDRSPAPQSHKVAQPVSSAGQFEHDRDALRASFDRLARSISTLTPQRACSLPEPVITVAQPPLAPVTPKMPMVALASVSAGLLLGIAGALFARAAEPKISTVTQSEPAPPAAPSARGPWDGNDDIEWRI